MQNAECRMQKRAFATRARFCILHFAFCISSDRLPSEDGQPTQVRSAGAERLFLGRDVGAAANRGNGGSRRAGSHWLSGHGKDQWAGGGRLSLRRDRGGDEPGGGAIQYFLFGV